MLRCERHATSKPLCFVSWSYDSELLCTWHTAVLCCVPQLAAHCNVSRLSKIIQQQQQSKAMLQQTAAAAMPGNPRQRPKHCFSRHNSSFKGQASRLQQIEQATHAPTTAPTEVYCSSNSYLQRTAPRWGPSKSGERPVQTKKVRRACSTFKISNS